VADAEQELAQLDRTLLRVRNETAAAHAQLARMKDGLSKPAQDSAATGQYRWDDNAALVRLPKRLLADVQFRGNANAQGELSPEIRGILQLTDDETRKVQSAIDRFTAAYQKLILKIGRPVEPTLQELGNRSRDQVLVLDFQGLKEPAQALHQELLADLGATLDTERLRILRDSLNSWVQVADTPALKLKQEIFVTDLRIILTYQGDSPYRFVSLPNSASVSVPRSMQDVPHFLKPLIQLWHDGVRQTTQLPSAPTIPSDP
jgi:hypothetical protein